MNTGYKPNLDEVEELMAANPQYFNTLQASRQIRDARANSNDTVGQIVQQSAADAQYGEYLRRGGPPMGADGAIPASQPIHDVDAEDAACDCNSPTPCCVTKLELGCSHTAVRLTLPREETDGRRCMLALVADKNEGGLHDKLKIKATRTPNPDCKMNWGGPGIISEGPEGREIHEGFEWEQKLEHYDADQWPTGDLAQLGRLFGDFVFKDVDELGYDQTVMLTTCQGTSAWGSLVKVYPKVEWGGKISGGLQGRWYTNANFTCSAAIDGEITGQYSNTSINISTEAKSPGEAEEHSKSVIPFLDRAMNRLKTLSSGGPPRGSGTHSYIGLNHTFNMEGSFKLAENGNDPSRVGQEMEIKIGYNPLLGIELKLDIFDLILQAAKRYPLTSGLASALEAARERMAEGIGTRTLPDGTDGNVYASAEVELSLTGKANIGNTEVVLSRKPEDERVTGTGRVGGDVSLELLARVEAEGKVYVISGAAKASGAGTSKLTYWLSTLAEGEGEEGHRFRSKLEWEGLKFSYHTEVTASFLGINMRPRHESGELVVAPPRVWIDETF